MYELTEAERLRLAPQADGAGTMAPPEGLEAQLRTGALAQVPAVTGLQRWLQAVPPRRYFMSAKCSTSSFQFFHEEA
jgi:hypothetical protein